MARPIGHPQNKGWGWGALLREADLYFRKAMICADPFLNESVNLFCINSNTTQIVLFSCGAVDVSDG